MLASFLVATAKPQSLQHDTHIQESAPVKEVKKDHELEAIVDALPGMSPEFGADIAIRLEASNRISDRSLKLDLLTRAFYLAESAQEPVKRDALPGTLVDTSSGYRAMGFGLNLDRESLQSRAVEGLLVLDAKRARDLFDQMKAPVLPALACEEPLTYDLSLPYELLSRLVAQGFTPKEKSEGMHLALLTAYVGELQSHAQVIPAAQLLQTAALSSADRAELTILFLHSLERLRGDERSFTTAIGWGGGLNAFARLMAQLEAKQTSAAGLLQVLRAYLVANVRGTRCPDMAQNRTSGSLPSVIIAFNELPSIQNVQITPIKADEIQDFQVASGPSVHAYWHTSPSHELLTGCQKLRFGSTEQPLTLEQRKEASWSEQLADYVTALESWKPENEAPEDFFHEKSVLYTCLIDLVPEGPDRLRIIASYVSFLEWHDVAQQSRIEWFMHVNDLIKRSHGWRETERRELLNALVNSRDLNLSVYAQFERWASLDGTAPARTASATH